MDTIMLLIICWLLLYCEEKDSSQSVKSNHLHITPKLIHNFHSLSSNEMITEFVSDAFTC